MSMAGFSAGRTHTRALCAVVLALGLAAGGARAAEPEPTAIGVVDVSEIFKNYKKVMDLQRQIDGYFEVQRKDLEQQEAELIEAGNKLRNLRDSLPGDSELLFDMMQKFQKMEFKYRKKERALQAEMQKRYAGEMEKVLNDIRSAIHHVAKDGAFELILRAPYGEEYFGEDETKPKTAPANDPLEEDVKQILAPRSTLDLLGKFQRNPVLFGAKTADITKDVLKRLNKDYEESVRLQQQKPQDK